MTPLEIEILLHYRCVDADFDRINSPAGQEACKEFVKLGLLERADPPRKYIGNLAALDVYVEALCMVPLPKRSWVIKWPVKKKGIQ